MTETKSPLVGQANVKATARPGDAFAGALGRFPLSFMQESLWLIHQMAPDISAYNIPEARHFRGRLDVPALQMSLDELLRRHESLRTVFLNHDGNPSQMVLRPGRFSFESKDLSHLKPNADELQCLLKAEAGRPFDLENGPLARATLFRLGKEEHVLLINLHHIICDQWSLNLLFEELARNYRAISSGSFISAAELPIQYADFAVWQRETLKDQALQELLEYWRKKLDGALPRLALAMDFRRPSFLSFRGHTQFFTLPIELTQALKQLSRSQGVTLFMTLIGALKVFLNRYCHQTDIVVGAPMTRRDPVETQCLIGHFVNTHPLRTDLTGNPSFCELLHRIRETVLGADAHQSVSADQVLRQLRTEGTQRTQSLFQVVCGLQPSPSLESYGSDLFVDRMEVDNGGSKFDWTLLFTESSRGLDLRCEYSTDLFEPTTITRWVRHFETLLKGITAQPEWRLSKFQLLTEAERVRLLSQPQCSSEPQIETCIHERFEQQAMASEGATAITLGRQTVSYGELNARANQLARHLRRLNAGPETPIALFLERSTEMIVAILAVLKAGAVYVPIDPTYPKERLRFIMEDTGAPIVLTHENLREALGPTAAKTICLDSEWPTISRESEENLSAAAKADNAAYIIYTSGSTGKPKGVVITHQNVIRLFAQTEHWFNFKSSDVWSLFHSYTFDFSVWEMWGALLYGGRLLIVPHKITRSPAEFYRLVAAEKVTILSQTPSAFQQLIWAEEQEPAPLPLALRAVVFGGEALDLQSLRLWFETHGDQQPRLINMYGITETTVHVTYRVIQQADLAKGVASPIGVPIPDLQLYLLDEDMEPVPPGVPGEIFVGGAGVARGYLNRPELTQERFIPDPFTKSSARLYRSGDLARYNTRGELEYWGR
ncbi:MAG TPA: amino acid adenylation domain-containing protein, partial [Candidatus Limnocylindrales bacterium]|nr:amino acid adenylation domain-containing protein [Candidatus Limnocylindrales bacterium]